MSKASSLSSDNYVDSVRIVGTEESLERWGWLFQILEEDGTIEIVSRPERAYPMRGSNDTYNARTREY